MSTYPMNPVDAAWFHMDGPANLAIVTGVLQTRQPLDFEKVREVYRERLAGFVRFRQRVVETGFPLATPHWEDVPHFDIDQHVHHIALAEPRNQDALRALVSDIASTPLDHAQPLWQVVVVDHVEGGSALVMRCHHCVADGTAMMTVAQKLFDTSPQAPHRAAPSTAAPTSDFAENGHLLAPALNAIAHASRNAMAMADTVLDVVTHPQQAMERAALVFNGAGMLVRELLKTDDPQSPFKGEFARRKLVAWSQPVAIKDVKAIGAPYDAKVNDVLVAAMTGALRNYLVRRGVKVNHTTLRAMVPVDMRSPEHMGHLGNAFGLVILELAVNKARPEQRLTVTKTRMDALKGSPEAMATLVLFDLLGRAPKGVEDFANDLFGSKASLVLTNVVGPREMLYLAGVPIDHMVGWAPHPGKQLGMAVSIMSYRGMVSLTVITDAHLIPDPELITDLFNTEFKTMLTAHKAEGCRAPQKEVVAKTPRASKTPVKTAREVPKRTSRPAA